MSRLLAFALSLFLCGPAWGCDPQIQVPAVIRLSPWVSEPLARGGTVQEPLDIRASRIDGCGELLLGVEIDASESRMLQVTSGPNGAPIGREPGAGLALLPLAPEGADQVGARAMILWSMEGTALRAGAATAGLRLRLFPADALLPEPLQELDVTLIAMVPALLELAVVTPAGRSQLAGSRTILDLGEITGGARHGLDIEVRGNSAVRLVVTPEHGELRLRGRPERTIPYTLQLDGRPVGPAGLAEALLLTDGEARLRLDLQIGDVERRAAGEYVDVLMISLAPE